MKNLKIATAVVAGLALVGWVFWITDDHGADRESGAITLVDPSVANHGLLDEVLTLDAKRAAGSVNFSYVPKNRPDGLRSMAVGSAGKTFVDGYGFGHQRIQVFVEFSAQPTDTCEGREPDGCVRETTLNGATDDPQFRNVTAYLTVPEMRKAAPGDATVSELRKFWSRAELVPIAEARWFADLLAEARAAPKQRF